MKELWISVSARIGEKDVVWRAVEFLGISEDTAIACLVRFWGGVAANAEDGDLRDKSDAQIEKWAGWKGESGEFARYIREHCVRDGIVRHWDETHGKLEARKRADRDRKSRGGKKETPPKDDGNSAEIPAVSAPTVPNPITTPPPPQARARAKPEEADTDPLMPAEFPERYRGDLVELLEKSGNAAKIVSELTAMTTGLHPPVYSWEELGLAVHDLVTNAKPWNARSFRRYAEGAREQLQGDAGTRESAGSGGARDVTADNPRVVPFGEHRDESIDHLQLDDLERCVTWAKENFPKRFGSFVAAGEEAIRTRRRAIEEANKGRQLAWWVRAHECDVGWDEFWERMQREAKAAGRNPVVYAYEHQNEAKLSPPAKPINAPSLTAYLEPRELVS